MVISLILIGAEAQLNVQLGMPIPQRLMNKFSCISLTYHYIFKMAAMTGCYENFIYNNLLISQLSLIKFVLKFVCVKMPVFQNIYYLLCDLL